MKGFIGLAMCLIAFIANAQPISFEWRVEDEGGIQIDVPLAEAETFFFNSGWFPFYLNYTLYPTSKRALRKQKRIQKDYDNTLVIDWHDEALETEKFSVITISPFQEGGNDFYPFLSPFSPFHFQDTSKIWETYNYSRTGYTCRGGMWISSYFIDLRRGSNQLPDSIISGSIYRHEDSLEKKVPQTLWQYWYNEHNQFERIVLSSLEYPEYVSPKTIIHFNYDHAKRLRQVICFSDTSESSRYLGENSISARLEDGFYLDHEVQNDLFNQLTNPEEGQELKAFIEYTYNDSHLVRCLTYSNSWLSILKDSIVYEKGLPSEIFRFGEKSSCSIDRFEYDSKNKLSRYLSFRYVPPGFQDASQALVDRRFNYITRKELNLRQMEEGSTNN